MVLLRLIFTTLVTVQVYYMYKFIYSIPLRYAIPESENEYLDIGTFLRGIKPDKVIISNENERILSKVIREVTQIPNPKINYTSHETHTQIHLPQLHQEQTRSDNSTALTYMPVTILDAVGRF